MRVTGEVTVRLRLDNFEFSGEDWEDIKREVGDRSPARMISELVYRKLMSFPWEVLQVSTIPESREEPPRQVGI